MSLAYIIRFGYLLINMFNQDKSFDTLDCLEAQQLGIQPQCGVYTIKPEATPIQVQCDMVTDGGGWTVSGKVYIIKPEATPIQVQCDMVMDGEGWTVSGRCSSFNPRPRPSKSNIYRLLTKYRDICPTAVVVRLRPELARAWVRTTIKCGHISRYLINNLFIVYPCFSTIRFRLMNLKFIYSKPNNNHS